MDIRLDDMKLFAALAEAQTFTAAARALGLPKQTLSRRIGELEEALGVQLVLRTTRRMQLTEAGRKYADRCIHVVRIADDANRAVVGEREEPHGVLRITADSLFGEAFLPRVLNDFAAKWPRTRLEVLLTSRQVDVVEERFDVAFRIGRVDETALASRALGPARVRFCASPSYLRRRGRPGRPSDLVDHDCIVVRADLGPSAWPFRGKQGGVQSVTVDGRYRCNSHQLAYQAVLDGLGIGVFAEFACATDVRRRRLASVLDDWRVDVGHVWLLQPRRQFPNVTVERFTELAIEHLGSAPWA